MTRRTGRVAGVAGMEKNVMTLASATSPARPSVCSHPRSMHSTHPCRVISGTWPSRSLKSRGNKSTNKRIKRIYGQLWYDKDENDPKLGTGSLVRQRPVKEDF